MKFVRSTQQSNS